MIANEVDSIIGIAVDDHLAYQGARSCYIISDREMDENQRDYRAYR